MRKVRTTLGLLLLGAALTAVLSAPAAAQDNAILAGHQALRTALDQKDYPSVWQQAHAILNAAAARDPQTLTGPEQYAVAVAHYYLVAESLDQALKLGNLTQEQLERATAMHARILGLERVPPTAAAVPPLGTPPANVPPAAGAAAPVAVISRGQQVDLDDYKAAGKTTIFDFFSEYCGPCRMLSPQLEKLVRSRPDLALVKVDINRPGVQGIDWQSPVARQYGLQSIPHLKVFGPDGKLVAEGAAASQLVDRWCQGER